MMLGMMHVDPLQLISFLDTTETGLKLVNTILREPARTDAEFRKKLTGLFRELHTIKGEASALNLMSIASRVHALEDMVSECKKKRGAVRQRLPAAGAEARRPAGPPAQRARDGRRASPRSRTPRSGGPAATESLSTTLPTPRGQTPSARRARSRHAPSRT